MAGRADRAPNASRGPAGALRFGVLALQDAPLATQRERWRLVEKLGFDDLHVADHTRDFRHAAGPWLEGWSVLTAMALATERVRIGTLVSNPIIRPPGLLALQAATVDRLSGGRLELGIGRGIAAFDHAAMGVGPWRPRERSARFAEYVAVVDGLLRERGRFSFAGRYHATSGMALEPGPLQRPRPPITVAGQAGAVLGVAAERADCWNTHGPFGRTAAEILELTSLQNARLDALCRARGRDPLTLRRSLLLFGSLDAWASPNAFADIVERFVAAGVGEFVVLWPGDDRVSLIERAAAEAASMRRSLEPAG